LKKYVLKKNSKFLKKTIKRASTRSLERVPVSVGGEGWEFGGKNESNVVKKWSPDDKGVVQLGLSQIGGLDTKYS
jgi:hypothetical protein